MNKLIDCPKCSKLTEYSSKFCPQCGTEIYFDLEKIDKSKKEYNDKSFLLILTAIYNLTFNPNNPDKDLYSNPESRQLIVNRYELEYKTVEKVAIISTPNKIEKENNSLQIRFNLCVFNARTGYSIRVAEELVSKNMTMPLKISEIKDSITMIEKIYAEEYLIKNVIMKVSNPLIRERLLFIAFLQDENKHMNYFLEEPILARIWDSIVDTNIELFKEQIRKKMILNDESVMEEVINDLTFGYCVRLSESLFPIN